MSTDKATNKERGNPLYKTCPVHKIIYVHECPYCANKRK